MAQAGESILVEASADVQYRYFWKISQPYLDPRTIVYEPERQLRVRQYQTWECRAYDAPISGQAVATPDGFRFESYENNSQYDQGRLVYVHRDVFVQQDFGTWGLAVPGGTPADEWDSVLVEQSADQEHRWFWQITNDPENPQTIVYEPIRQTRERPCQIWESRLVNTSVWGQVAPAPAGLELVHWENVCEYDQGPLVYVHRDTFTTPGFTTWTPEVVP
jgi:hypothetical protein